MRIKITKTIYQKVMHWVHKADFEVSGMGLVTYDGDGTFTVVDAFLPKQEGGAAHTDIDPTAMGKLMYEVHKAKKPGHLVWWWHSHVKMSTFWSVQDKETIRKFAAQGFCVATVFNQRNESRSMFSSIYKNSLGMEQLFEKDEIELLIVDPDFKTDPAWDKEFEANVEREKRVTLLDYSGDGYADYKDYQTRNAGRFKTPDFGDWFTGVDGVTKRWDYKKQCFQFWNDKNGNVSEADLLKDSEEGEDGAPNADENDEEGIEAADGLFYLERDLRYYARVLKINYRTVYNVFSRGTEADVAKMNAAIDSALAEESAVNEEDDYEDLNQTVARIHR